MSPSEAAVLLSMAAVFDNRQIDDVQATAWADALDGIGLDDAKLAIRNHFRTSAEWLKPVHIRRFADRLRTERARAFLELTPPDWLAEMDDGPEFNAAYLRWQRGAKADILAGRTPEQGRPVLDPVSADDVAEVVETMRRQLGSAAWVPAPESS